MASAQLRVITVYNRAPRLFTHYGCSCIRRNCQFRRDNMKSLSRFTLNVKLSTVQFLISLALLTITGCYLYFPDVRLDSDVKANPSGYACRPYKAHPFAARFRSCGTPVEAISLVPTPYAA